MPFEAQSLPPANAPADSPTSAPAKTTDTGRDANADADAKNREDPAARGLLGVDNTHALRFKLARQAQHVWAQTAVEERARRLTKIADHMLERQDELVAVVCAENGKRDVEAIAHEVGASVATIRWLCEQGVRSLRTESVGMPWMPHRTAKISREAWGVVLVISPWNFPLSIPMGQVVAGLLAGNAVILKPSEITPNTGAIIESLLEGCRLPVNLFAVVQGDGSTGAALLEQRPDKVFFTGSQATGRKVMTAAAQFPIPVTLELGGVDAMIVLEDADLDLASSAAVWGSFFNGGQVCASVERILVHERLRKPLVERILDKTAQLDPATDLGPITAPKQAQIYRRHLADAHERGLAVRCGGDFLDARTLAPTLIEGPGIEQAQVYREETFGPIVAVHTFRSDSQAVQLHNELWGGLTASIFTADPARAETMAKGMHAGLISVNDVAATLHAVPELPWGGVGSSGFGRSHGVEGLLEFTWAKVLDTPRSAKLGFKRPWWFPYGSVQTELLDAYGRIVGQRKLSARISAAGDATRCLFRLLVSRPRT